MPEQFEALTGRENMAIVELHERQKIFIAGNEGIRVGGEQCAEYGNIIRVATRVGRNFCGFDDGHVLAQGVGRSFGLFRGNVELLRSVFDELVENPFGCEAVMLL